MATDKTFALVARGPASAGQWALEAVVPRPIRDDEVLVRILASGICLADIHFGDIPATADNPAVWYPRVLGHEGAGYVEEVGRNVLSVKKHDPVLLSYLSCGNCCNCRDNDPAYCTELFNCNFRGEKGIYAVRGSQEFDIGGSFFGQSSFASHAVVKGRSVVNLASMDPTEDELKVLAPLGCGVQTGTGAFVNAANVQASQDVAVIGVGGVGMSAIMAANMRGCRTIIAIDRTASRLQLAKRLGATHTIDTTDKSIDLVAEVLQITSGRGVHVSLDTSGVQSLARQSWSFVRNHGKILQIGLAKPGDLWDVSMADHMNSGKQIIGVLEGDAIPQEYAPLMVEWFRQGKLPVQEIVKLYPVEKFQQALDEMRAGSVIKPVLVWPTMGSSRL